MSDYLAALQALNAAQAAVSRVDPDHPALAHLDAATDSLVAADYKRYAKSRGWKIPA